MQCIDFPIILMLHPYPTTHTCHKPATANYSLLNYKTSFTEANHGYNIVAHYYVITLHCYSLEIHRVSFVPL